MSADPSWTGILSEARPYSLEDATPALMTLGDVGAATVEEIRRLRKRVETLEDERYRQTVRARAHSREAARRRRR